MSIEPSEPAVPALTYIRANGPHPQSRSSSGPNRHSAYKLRLFRMRNSLNLYALCLFGPELERLCGCGPFALIYVSAGTAGSLGSMLMSRQIGSGASGAVLGICGALLVTRYKLPR